MVSDPAGVAAGEMKQIIHQLLKIDGFLSDGVNGGHGIGERLSEVDVEVDLGTDVEGRLVTIDFAGDQQWIIGFVADDAVCFIDWSVGARLGQRHRHRHRR